MALTRITSEFVYQSGDPGQLYTFRVVMDSNNQVSVQDITTPWGTMCGPGASLPESVLDDIQTAITQVEDLVAQTSAVNGTLTFSNETFQDVVFTAAMTGTSYRVLFSVEDFIAVRVTNKTTTGFRVEASAVYSGDIGYDVLV
jgi:hypothetical protein